MAVKLGQRTVIAGPYQKRGEHLVIDPPPLKDEDGRSFVQLDLTSNWVNLFCCGKPASKRLLARTTALTAIRNAITTRLEADLREKEESVRLVEPAALLGLGSAQELESAQPPPIDRNANRYKQCRRIKADKRSDTLRQICVEVPTGPDDGDTRTTRSM